MKALWVLALVAVALVALGEGARRRGGPALRRRQHLSSAAYAPRPRPPPRRSAPAPPPPPPRCHADVTHPDAEAEYEAKAKGAPFVFTGKVIGIRELGGGGGGGGRAGAALQVDANGVDLEGRGRVFEVRLKRALKGQFPWSLLDVELSKPHLHKTVEVVVSSHAPDHATTDAPTAATPPRCRHALRQNHTAIFLARRDPDSRHFRLQLAANPLALTLRNLDKVNAAVRDIPYKPVPPIIEEPCEKQYCAYGASCVADGEGRARCQCPADCPDVHAPVCGSDGVTYDNHCLLRQKACRDQASVRVQYSGECGAGRSGPHRRG